MPIDVQMTQLSPTMTEGRIARWLKKEGDTLESGQVMAEIETDKATMELEVVDEGIMHKILVPQGATVNVGTPIAVIAEEGEEVPEDYEPEGESAPAQPAEQATAESAKAPEPAKTEPAKPVAAETSAPATSGKSRRIKASPLARRLATEKGINQAYI